MTSTMKTLDSGQGARREQQQARIARKHERRQARQLKQATHAIALEYAPAPELICAPSRATQPTEPAATATPVPVSERAASSETVVAPAPPEARKPAASALAQRPTIDGKRPAGKSRKATRQVVKQEARRAPHVSRRERDIAAFLARREQILATARAEAKERLARLGEEAAVADALAALAHSCAAPWQCHRERLAEALRTGQIPEVGGSARRACRGAASDAARSSRRAPDSDLALAVAVAYAVIGQAPWSAVRGRRAERDGAPPRTRQRAFWR